jgi:hypothetical protein
MKLLGKIKIFVQDQGMRKILPQAYEQYSEDKILSITLRLGEKAIFQGSHNRFRPLSLS